MVESIFKILIQTGQSAISVLKVIFRSSLFYKRSKIEEPSCIILGNGPSLSKSIEEHTSVYQNSTLLCVNGFSTSAYFETLKPKYYILAAPELWSENTTDSENKGIRSAMVSNLIEKTTWDLHLFMPTNSRKNKRFIAKIKSNPKIQISYFNSTGVDGIQWFSWLLHDLGLGIPRPHNVIVPSLLIAITSEVKTIKLVGVDHSWIPLVHVDEHNNALLAQKHFYDEDKAKAKPMYRLGQHRRKLHEMLEKFYFTFRSYFEIKAYADHKKIKIYNCTKGSFIDAFERLPLEQTV